MAKNFGDQIKDAIQEAITSQDFSSVKSVVEQSINAAASSIATGLSQAQSNVAQANAEHIRRQNEYFNALNAQRNELMAVQNRYTPANGIKASGYAMAIGGGVLAVSFGVLSLLAFLGAGLFSAGFAIGATVMLCLCGGSVAMSVFGAKRAGFAKRFQAYRRILGTRTFCTIKELAAQTGETDNLVEKDLHKMIDKGMFREGHLDDQATTLMVTNATYEQYRETLRSKAERDREQQLLASVEGNKKETPLSLEAKAMLERGQAYLAKIAASNDEIPDPVVSEKLEQTETILQTIFKRAQEHPEVLPDLEQLMDYYLPLTIKLLDAYEELDGQPIQSDAIQSSKKEIEETLDTLNTAFEKLLDSIFKDITWDVSTDITVLHTVLAQEGLIDNPFERPQEEDR